MNPITIRLVAVTGILMCSLTGLACQHRPATGHATLADVRHTLARAKSPRILWIGNSYSFGAPAEFQRLAQRRGRAVHCSQVTHRGWSLSQHARHPETLQAIRSQRWDVVILQEQSRRPAVPWRLVWQSLPAAKSLAEEIRQAGAMPVLYQTWAYRNGDPGRPNDSFAHMTQRLERGYQRLSLATGAPVVAVGSSWARALQSPQPPHLFLMDGAHPSQQGVSLIAKTFISSMLSENP